MAIKTIGHMSTLNLNFHLESSNLSFHQFGC
jgi:hypothetical protein